MRRFVVQAIFVVGLLAVLEFSQSASAQTSHQSLKVFGSVAPPRNASVMHFETLSDALGSVGNNILRVPTTDGGRLEVLWGDSPIVLYDGDYVSSWVDDWTDDYITIITDPIGDGDTYVVSGAVIEFSLTTDGQIIVTTSDWSDHNAIRGTVGGTTMTGIVTSSASVCRCWGGDTNTVRTTCTTAQCDDAGTQCSTSGLTAYCSWRAGMVAE